MMSKYAYYWASTEYSRTGAWYVGFYDGGTGDSNKYGSHSVRAAVAFTFNL